MTFRPPPKKPTRRRSRQTDVRRSVIFTATFGLASVAAVAVLGSVLFANWYTDHGAPVASVNGVAISKDAVRNRASVDLARLQRQINDYGILRNEAEISSADYSNLTSNMVSNEDPTTLYQNALNELTQEMTLRQYADQHGISVSAADVEAQITTDATIPEMRHVMVIGVEPVTTPPLPHPMPMQVVTAYDTAESYLSSIKSGAKKWADVSTVAAANLTFGSSNTGDLGLVTRTGLKLDPALVDDIFSLQKVNDLTPVVKCDDGIYRFATVTQIVAPYVDQGWQNAIGQASSAGDYRSLAQAEALQAAVEKSVESQYVSGPMVSRQVQEIFISAGFGQPGDGEEAKVKMIIFAPNHDASSASTVAQGDPAWVAAKARADAAYATLEKDPSQFGTLASDTTNNDDPNASYLPGGDYPWLPDSFFIGDPSSGTGLGMTTVPAAIFGSGSAFGIMAPILEPSLGYVVVDFQGLRPAPDQRIADAQIALATGSSFDSVVAQYSEAPNATSNGDMGWVTPYEFASDIQDAIFQAPVGGLSRMVSDGSGYYIFKVTAQETMTPDAAQQEKLKTVVPSSWLSDLANSANIWTDSAGLTAITPASPTP